MKQSIATVTLSFTFVLLLCFSSQAVSINDTTCLNEAVYGEPLDLFPDGVVGPQIVDHSLLGAGSFLSIDARETMMHCSTFDGEIDCFNNITVDNACIFGAEVEGFLYPLYDIEELADNFDVGAIKIENPVGPVRIEYSYLSNFKDVLTLPDMPVPGYNTTVEHSLLNFGLHTAIENHGCNDLSLKGTLLRANTGISMNPSENGMHHVLPAGDPAIVSLENVIIELLCTDDNRPGLIKCDSGMNSTIGGFFDFPDGVNSSCNTSDGIPPQLQMEDVFLYLENMPAHGMDDLVWPSGIYENVTLFWAGPGPYPGPVPPIGVSVSTNSWLFFLVEWLWSANHGCPNIEQPCHWNAN